MERKFERVRLPQNTDVFALDEYGRRLGRVHTLGPGGLLLATNAQLMEGSPYHIVLVDESEHIRRPLVVVVRYRNDEGIGLEFRAMDIDTAVDIGIIIGKYYAAAHAAHV
jgi:hypothetical protein